MTPAQVVDMSVTTNDIPAEKVFLSCRQSTFIQVSKLLQALTVVGEKVQNSKARENVE